MKVERRKNCLEKVARRQRRRLLRHHLLFVATSEASSSKSNWLPLTNSRHWRFIACFHGPWLHMPIETLQTMCQINDETPHPHPVHPAVFYDIINIRKLIEEATGLAVRAASDGHLDGTKLSPERKFRIHRQACQKLGLAYQLDEIACSVATMQGASTLDGIAAKVLQRDGSDKDALYVDFFHEKIPSRQLAEHTSLGSLESIITQVPAEAETYRTRGIVRMLTHDLDDAVKDFTLGLSVFEVHGLGHRKKVEAHSLGDELTKESSLRPQFLFMRANVNLQLAVNRLIESFEPPIAAQSGAQHAQHGNPDSGKRRTADLHKAAKQLARRAFRDVMDFLSYFQYTPHLPLETSRSFNHRVSQAATGIKNPKNSPLNKVTAPETVYKTSDLFSAKPPADLPPFPSDEMGPGPAQRLPGEIPTYEAQTYHPLLMEALYALLLAHVVLQTSKTELCRHAYNVARLARLIDAYPIFQASRSICRCHWVGVLDAWREHDEPLVLANGLTWEQLCMPAPLPTLPKEALDGLAPDELPKTPTAAVKFSQEQSAGPPPGTVQASVPGEPFQQSPMTRWNVVDDGKENPSTTDWAVVLTRWIREVSVVRMGPKKRRKKKVGEGSKEDTKEEGNVHADGNGDEAGAEGEAGNLDLEHGKA